MATSELAHPDALLRERSPVVPVTTAQNILLRALAALASLRLTVVLFALAIFLVFVGTLAQKDHDVWAVVNDMYFRVWWAKVDLLTFERLAQMFFQGLDWNLTVWFPFPGGKAIGLALLINLFAAHAVRFKIAASGGRLVFGAAVIALGVLLTGLVIYNGMDQAIVSELSPAFLLMFWNLLRVSLAAVAAVAAYVLLAVYGRRRTAAWWVMLAAVVVVGLTAAWLLVNRSFRLDDSGLRILWQMSQGTAAGGVLLAGCLLVFRRRAGIVLLHAGVALIMISELWVAMTATESQMTIPEGDTVNFSSDIRTSELAVIDHAPAEHDRVTVIPQSLLMANVGASTQLENGDLPFAVRVHRWMPNSTLRAPTAGETNPATIGAGQRVVAEDRPQFAGVGDEAQKTNIPSAYVELFAPQTGKSLGTYLVSQFLQDQPVKIDGQTYDLALRFKRIYYPWSLTLKNFEFGRYTGTNTAKNFSSLVELNDPRHNVVRELSIWMNNPLRYDGKTLYQSSFDSETEKTTVLQLVSNPTWMAPYVAYALVLVGMLAHFVMMLYRFLTRSADERAASPTSASRAVPELASRAVPGPGSSPSHHPPLGPHSFPNPWSLRAVWFPALIVAFFGLYLVGKTRMPHSPPSEAQVYGFARLPLAYQGRIMPFDTVARNTLQVLSGRQEVIGEQKPGWFAQLFDVKEKTPAIFWLLEAIAGTDKSRDMRIFRIENLDLLEALRLARREGFRYSFNDLRPNAAELDRQIKLALQTKENERTLYQNKVLELATKLRLYKVLVESFQSPPISPEPDQLNASLENTRQVIADLRASSSPHAVPPVEATGRWTPLLEAEFQALLARVSNKPVNPATVALSSLIAAYANNDATGFNKHLANYRQVLADYEKLLAADAGQLKTAGVANAEILHSSRINFEVFYNQFSPLYYAIVLYLAAFVLSVLSWIGWTEPLRRASMWLLVLTFALTTLALVGRMYISGRPPVTNLYSATIFVGWFGVLLALAFEWIFRLGLGNIAAAVIGFLTLFVAHNLSLDGDTFLVLQAVLDTQFWLATHVITVNLGYGATVVAGMFGALYILMAHVFPVLDQDARRQLIRVTYGTLCFAIFFSFVGTVLGGLWADDSWGRFWGWDPKENGALIIVLWNALVLHARWGGIVKSRGFATLAVGGNIAVAWSGFGVNEFGVGLHAYGASESSTAMWLLTFALSQLVIMILGAMPSAWFERRPPLAPSHS